MASFPGPQAKPGRTSLVLSSECELRIRSYVVFHRISESVGLGMHPTDPYPRRNRNAPIRDVLPRTGRIAACFGNRQDPRATQAHERPIRSVGKQLSV